MPRRARRTDRPNRTDLPVPGSTAQPIRSDSVASGRPYGARASSEAALAAMPAAPEGGAATPTPDSPPGASSSALDGLIAAAAQAQSPGAGLLSEDPEVPEDITTGLSVGPGSGPEALPPMLGAGPDPSIALWQSWLPALGILASQPGSSPEVRQLYRRLRAATPPDTYEERGT